MRPHLAEQDAGRTRQPAWRWAVKLLLGLVPIVLLGELGHHELNRLGQVLAHHMFHVLFLGGAAVVFAVYAMVDIRRHGRPSFSWRLREPGQRRHCHTTDELRGDLRAHRHVVVGSGRSPGQIKIDPACGVLSKELRPSPAPHG
jgi:hypothetical protein